MEKFDSKFHNFVLKEHLGDLSGYVGMRLKSINLTDLSHLLAPLLLIMGKLAHFSGLQILG